MDSYLLGLCFGSCLKGEGSNIELYEALGFDTSNVSAEDIRQAFRKKTLQLHPDKLAQRGIQVTPEESLKFVKCKEAYEVLSDPKRRKRYDQLGLLGLKILENPRDINPSELIKNFKRNQKDRFKIAVLLGLLFGIVLIFPIIFALQCDGTLRASWLAIWTPAWLIDLLLLLTAFYLCGHQEDPNEDGSEVPEKLTTMTKLINFLETVLFILIQIFVLMRLDKAVMWSWTSTFSPWYIYEIVSVCSLVGPAFTKVTPPDETSPPSVEEGRDDEQIDPRIPPQINYFEKLVTQISSKVQIVCSLLRLWQAIFLAIKLDNGSWSWGLVFLPIWIYFAFQYGVSKYYRIAGERILQGLNYSDLQSRLASGGPVDPLHNVKYQQYEQLSATGVTVVCAQIVPIFMSIMLTFRLEHETYSTFLIILPVFIIVGCCCCCSMCCVAFMPYMLGDEMEAQTSPYSPPATTAEPNVYKDQKQDPAAAPPVYGTFVVEPNRETTDFLNDAPPATTNPAHEETRPAASEVPVKKDASDDLD